MRRKGTEMYCFTCKEDFESMMTCIYRVWEAKKGSQNVRLEIEPVEQMDLLTEYVHVEVDPELAHKVVRSIRTKISAKAYYQVYLAAMSNDPGRLDDIYRFLRIGFAVGGKVTECLREESVMQIFELSRQVSNERHFFREFLRFTRIEPGIYVALMEPKGNVVALVAEHFADRMPSEDWMIIDDRRGLGVIHFMLQSSGKKRWSGFVRRNSRKIFIRRCGKNFSIRLQWKKGRIRVAREICFRYDTENM